MCKRWDRRGGANDVHLSVVPGCHASLACADGHHLALQAASPSWSLQMRRIHSLASAPPRRLQRLSKAAVLSPRRRSTMSVLSDGAAGFWDLGVALGSDRLPLWATSAEIKSTSWSPADALAVAAGVLGLLRSGAFLPGSARATIGPGLAGGRGAGFATRADLRVSGGTSTPASSTVDKALASLWGVTGAALGGVSVMVAANCGAGAVSVGAAASCFASAAEGKGATAGALVAAGTVSAPVWFVRPSSPQATAIAPRPSSSKASRFFFGCVTAAELPRTLPRIRVWSVSPVLVGDSRLGLDGLGLGAAGCCKMYIPKLWQKQDF